jgi:hypothetical protein
MMQKVVIVSGYFNPIRKGHIEYFQNSKSNDPELLVNNKQNIFKL